MAKHKYDFIVVGRWRNRAKIEEVMCYLRAAGKSVYCFVENEYDGDGVKFETGADADVEKMMATTEQCADWRTNSTFRKIFETDMQGLRDAQKLVLVFPAGLAAHMELGAAYGMGKPCYGVGQPDKAETLYLMFDEIFPDAPALVKGMT